MRNLLLLISVVFLMATTACTSSLDELVSEIGNGGGKTPSAKCIDPSKIRRDVACTMQYDPVCGCDGKTYSNACFASISGVTSYVKGSCADLSNECKGEPNPAMICPAVYDPVCGCDGETYSNACNATAMGVKMYVKGACDSLKNMK